jgi:UDP-N-acetylglucosamine 2-epimerase (non-hydrolysing)
MIALLNTIKTLAEKYPHYNFIYPVHLNPNVRQPVNEILGETSNVLLTGPMDYLSFLFMMRECRFIMSDSGGVQEECFVFRKPIIVLRSVTERNEAIKAGYAFLTGSAPELINNTFEMIDAGLSENHNFFPNQNPFGDGNASNRIAEILEKN